MSETSDVRERIIDAAIEVIATKGESALRLIEIAAMASIKQPSIYYFFPSREDLVIAAHRERYRRVLLDVVETFETQVASATTQEEFVQSAMRGLRFAFHENRAEARLTRIALISKAVTNESLLREINDASFGANQRFAGVLENAQRQGWIRDDVSPLTLAIWIRAQVLGRLVLEIDSSRYDGDEWTTFAIDAIVSTLRKH